MTAINPAQSGVEGEPPGLTGEPIAGYMHGVLEALGEDVNRDGLLETPHRVAKALRELTAGYHVDVEALLKTFDAEGFSELVVVRDLPLYSMCEHHMLPFIGKAHIAYLPADRIVGLSKFGRLVNAFARRLQVQERLTGQVADTLERVLQPQGCMVVIEASHMCMTLRGVQAPGALTITSAVRGCFKDDDALRSETMSLLTRKANH